MQHGGFYIQEEGSDALTVIFVFVFVFLTYLYSVISENGAENICR